MPYLQRVIAVALIVLAVVIAVVPSQYNCATRDIYMYVTGMDTMGGAKDDGKGITPDEMMTGTTEAADMTATTTGTTGAMGATTATTMAGATGSGSTMAATSKGMKVPMKCFYSAKAAIGFAIPIGILGVLLFFARRKETTRMLAIMGIVLSGVTMAIPTLVGTCGSASAICNEVLKPTMILAGGAVLVLSALMLVLGGRGRASIA
jgi:Domain of unknown function (DUF4418)